MADGKIGLLALARARAIAPSGFNRKSRNAFSYQILSWRPGGIYID